MNQPCPYCGNVVVCSDSKMIYGKSFGWVWHCVSYPKCDAFVGCHPNSKRALGTPANAELRHIRKTGHATFDRIWKEGFLTRNQAYAWLANHLLIHIDRTHFAMFDKPTALKAIHLADDYYNRLKKNKLRKTT